MVLQFRSSSQPIVANIENIKDLTFLLIPTGENNGPKGNGRQWSFGIIAISARHSYQDPFTQW